MPQSIESSRFVSHTARISGEFNSRKNSHSTKFEPRPQILVKLCLRGLCDPKLSRFCPLNDKAIKWVQNGSKIVKWAMSSWDTNPWSNFFVTLTQNSSAAKNETQKPHRSIFSNAGENAKEDCWCEKYKNNKLL